MRLTKEALSIKVVVRRTKIGVKSFVWEISRDSMVEPVYVSPETFVNMEAAYRAGQARLAEFIPSPRLSDEMVENYLWQSRQNDTTVNDFMALAEQSHHSARL